MALFLTQFIVCYILMKTGGNPISSSYGGGPAIRTAPTDKKQGLMSKYVVDIREAGGAAPDDAPVRETGTPKIGVISNPRSHGNRNGVRSIDLPEAVVIRHAPDTHDKLLDCLREFAAQQMDLIVIDGGDGTIRDVLTAAHDIFGGRLPRFAVLQSGKTNALAMDLGVPRDWTIADALVAHQRDQVARREPILVRWLNSDRPEVLGFIFGFGAYVRATLLARRVHKQGWFHGPAVAMTVFRAVLATILGSARGGWRRGSLVRVSRDRFDILSERMFLILGSTLHQLPLGIKPFGQPRGGLKFLAVKAPPRQILRFLPAILNGRSSAALEENGYIRRDAERVFLAIRKGFILDGEHFPGGNLVIGRTTPVEFVVP